MTKKEDLDNTVFSAVKLLLHDRVDRLVGVNSKMGIEELMKIYPITLEVGPSGKCNNSCSFCMHAQYYNNGSNMPLSMYKKLVDEVSSYPEDLRTRGIIFSSSGEPLVNPEINDFIGYTKSSGIDVALITNGSALGREGLIETIAENVSWMRVSLNAGTPETRAKIHGVSKEDYSKVLNGITLLSNKKVQTNGSLNIGAQIVVTEENFKEIGLACEDIKRTGAAYFQIKPVVFHPMDGRKQLDLEFWQRVLDRAEQAKQNCQDEDFKVFIKYDQFSAIMKSDYDKSAYNTCRAVFFPIVEADGKVYHCSQTRGLGSMELGDLSNQSFKEIWEGDRRKNKIRQIDLSKCQPVCRCHANNKHLKYFVENGYTRELKDRVDSLKKIGGCAPNFV